MIKKNLFLIFSLFIITFIAGSGKITPSLPMDESSLVEVSFDKIYRSCTNPSQFKSINRNDVSLIPHSFDTYTCWHIGQLIKSDNSFYIDVKDTVQVCNGMPYTTSYTGTLRLLVLVSINLPQAQKIAWHSKHGKSIVALDNKNILYRLSIDYETIKIPQKIFKFFENVAQAKPDFLQVTFIINENRRNYLMYQKQRNLNFIGMRKWFEKEEIAIDDSFIKVLKDCQQNKKYCFLSIENQDTSKKTLFQIIDIQGDVDFFRNTQVEQSDQPLTNVDPLISENKSEPLNPEITAPASPTSSKVISKDNNTLSNIEEIRQSPSEKIHTIVESPKVDVFEGNDRSKIEEQEQPKEISKKPESLNSEITAPESQTPTDAIPNDNLPKIEETHSNQFEIPKVIESTKQENTKTENSKSILHEKKQFNFLNKYTLLLGALSLGLFVYHFSTIQLYYFEFINNYGKMAH